MYKLSVLALLLGVIALGYGGLCNINTQDESTVAGSSAPLPSAVSNLNAFTQSSSQISLTWEDNTNNENGFKIERSQDGVNFTQIATVNPNTTNYLDSALSAGTTYHYRVCAYNANGDSMWTNVASVTTSAPEPSLPPDTTQTPTPNAPAQVTSPNPADGANNIPITQTLTWSPAENAASYDVYFSGTNPPAYFSNITATSCGFGTLSYSTTYYWRIDARNSAGTTAGNIWSFTTQQTPPIPETSHWVLKITNGINGSPSTRAAHSMVWDGQRIIMFGGHDNAYNYKNDLWWYEPVTNTWVLKTPTGDSPTGRAYHSMVWDGQKVIMFGGIDSSYSLRNDLWWYDPITNAWTQKIVQGSAGPPSARKGHSMVWDGQKVIMFGGIDGSDSQHNDLWWYDPVANTWTEKIPVTSPPARWEHSMTWDGQKVIMFGGGEDYNDLWWYNPGTNTWAEKIPDSSLSSPTARAYHSMVWDGQKVILFGGAVNGIPTNELWWYAPVVNTWTQKLSTGNLPSARYSHSMVWAGQRMILFGGWNNDLWWYTPDNTTVWSKVDAGYSHTVALKSDGTLWAWGSNESGELGDGTTASKITPTQIGTDTNWLAIAAGNWYTVALKTDGSLWAWGANGAGQLGDGTNINKNTPTYIGAGYRAIAAGNGHTVALKTDGSLWTWGNNWAGQLGDGTNVSKNIPTLITNTTFSTITVGDWHTVALKTDGTIWAWGSNGDTQLGDGTNTSKNTPTYIGTGYSVVAAGCYHTVALKADGSLWAWGTNGFGQNIPTLITDTIFSTIAAGVRTFTFKPDGSTWAWGINRYGELGDGTTTDKNTLTYIGTGYSAIAAGTWHTVALKPDGSIWAWGWNCYGQLGLGDTTDRLVPTQIQSGQ